MGISTLGERYLVESKHSTSPKSTAKIDIKDVPDVPYTILNNGNLFGTLSWQLIHFSRSRLPEFRFQPPNLSYICRLLGSDKVWKARKQQKHAGEHDTWWFLPRTRLEFRNRIQNSQNMNYIWDKSSKGKQLWKINFRRLLERKYFKWQERRSTNMLIDLKVEI